VGLQIGHPELEALEGVLICEVEADQYSANILVIHAGNVAEPFLASCIPDIKPHNIFDVGVIRVLHLQGLDLEVPGECRSVPCLELPLYKPLNEGSLAHHGLAYHDDLELLGCDGALFGIAHITPAEYVVYHYI
jgi:hypothetical protein